MSAIPVTDFLRIKGKPQIAADKETGLISLQRVYSVDIDAVRQGMARDTSSYSIADYVKAVAGEGEFHDREYTNCWLVDQKIQGEGDDLTLVRTFQELGEAGILIEIGQPNIRTAKGTKEPIVTRQFIVKNPYYPHPNAIDVFTFPLTISTATDPNLSTPTSVLTLRLRGEAIDGRNVFSIVTQTFGASGEDIGSSVNIRNDCSIQINKTLKGARGSLFDPEATPWNAGSYSVGFWPTLEGREYYLTAWNRRELEDSGEEVFSYTFIGLPPAYAELKTMNFQIPGRAYSPGTSVSVGGGGSSITIRFALQPPVNYRGVGRIEHYFNEGVNDPELERPYTIHRYSAMEIETEDSGFDYRALTGYLSKGFSAGTTGGPKLVVRVSNPTDQPTGQEVVLDAQAVKYVCGFNKDGNFVPVYTTVNQKLQLPPSDIGYYNPSNLRPDPDYYAAPVPALPNANPPT